MESTPSCFFFKKNLNFLKKNIYIRVMCIKLRSRQWNVSNEIKKQTAHRLQLRMLETLGKIDL